MPDDRPRCSARGCRASATVLLVWRNPRIHGPSVHEDGAGGRVKTWPACAEHRASLGDFLGRRDFLLRTDDLPPD